MPVDVKEREKLLKGYKISTLVGMITNSVKIMVARIA